MPTTRQLYFFHDGPCDFLTKEQQAVDQVAVAHTLAVEWLNARDRLAGPLVLRFNITELPTLVLELRESQRRSLHITRHVQVTGPDLRKPHVLTKWLTKHTLAR